MIDRTHKNGTQHSCWCDEHVIGDNGAPQGLSSDRRLNGFPTRDFLSEIRPGIVELLTSFECARSVECDVWDFAVEIRRLRKAGLAENEFRWLVFKEYVDHARELTGSKVNGRQFRQTGNLSFTRRTCFVLTEVGVLFARTVLSQIPAKPSIFPIVAKGEPTWDPYRRELRIDEHVVKRFRCSAKNQERILASFEEEGWPHRIDDPIPPKPDQNQSQRLRDAICSLNKHQQSRLIRFRGDGSGRGVVWELVIRARERNGDR